MDMSKLPRLSQTETPPPPPAEPTPAAPQPVLSYVPAPAAGLLNAGEAWIAAIVGVIFTYLGRRFGSYVLSLIGHQPFHTGFTFGEGGPEVPYPQLANPPHAMINDAAMFLFGIAMLLDAAVIATAYASPRLRRPLLTVALLITASAVIFNLFVAAVFFKDGTLPLFSLLAVAIGGYSAMVQWTMLKLAKQEAPTRA